MTRTLSIGRSGVRAAVPQADATKRVESLRRRARNAEDDEQDEESSRRPPPPPGMGKLVDKLV